MSRFSFLFLFFSSFSASIDLRGNEDLLDRFQVRFGPINEYEEMTEFLEELVG